MNKMNYTITMTQKGFDLTESGKGFKKDPTYTEKRVITEDEYNYFTGNNTLQIGRNNGCKEAVTREYTAKGFTVNKRTTITPCGRVKWVKDFDFEEFYS